MQSTYILLRLLPPYHSRVTMYIWTKPDALHTLLTPRSTAQKMSIVQIFLNVRYYFIWLLGAKH